MEILTIFIFIFSAFLVVIAVIVSCLKIKKDDENLEKKQDNGLKYTGEENVNVKVSDGKVVGVAEITDPKNQLKKVFSLRPILKDAVSVCPSLKNIEKRKEYYDEIYRQYYAYLNFEELEKIVKEKNFKHNGNEKIYEFLMQQYVDFDHEPTAEDAEFFHQTLIEKGVHLVDNKKIFELAIMKIFGFGCKQDLRAGFLYLQSAADFGNKKAMEIIYPFSNSFGGDFDTYKQAELFENLWFLKRGDEKAMERFANDVFLDYEAQYFTTNKVCFDFALKCAEKVAEKDATLWYRLASMLMYYDEFKGTDEQKNVKKYLKNAVKFSAKDRKNAEKDLEVWG